MLYQMHISTLMLDLTLKKLNMRLLIIYKSHLQVQNYVLKVLWNKWNRKRICELKIHDDIYVIEELNGEEITGIFHKEELQKTYQ